MTSTKVETVVPAYEDEEELFEEEEEEVEFSRFSTVSTYLGKTILVLLQLSTFFLIIYMYLVRREPWPVEEGTRKWVVCALTGFCTSLPPYGLVRFLRVIHRANISKLVQEIAFLIWVALWFSLYQAVALRVDTSGLPPPEPIAEGVEVIIVNKIDYVARFFTCLWMISAVVTLKAIAVKIYLRGYCGKIMFDKFQTTLLDELVLLQFITEPERKTKLLAKHPVPSDNLVRMLPLAKYRAVHGVNASPIFKRNATRIESHISAGHMPNPIRATIIEKKTVIKEIAPILFRQLYTGEVVLVKSPTDRVRRLRALPRSLPRYPRAKPAPEPETDKQLEDAVLEKDHFAKFIPDKKLLNHAFKLADPNGKGTVSQKKFSEFLKRMYVDRKNIAATVAHHAEIRKFINILLNCAIAMCLFFMCFMILGINVERVLIPASTFLLAYTFIFGNTLKTFFESIIFVLIKHPFDVGDTIKLEGVTYRVKDMYVLSTELMKWDGGLWIMNNSEMMNARILNVRRSPGPLTEDISLKFGIHTPLETIKEFETRLKEYCENSPHWVSCDFYVTGIDPIQGTIGCTIWPSGIGNWHYSSRWPRFQELHKRMLTIMKDLNIDFRPVVQPVEYRQGPPAMGKPVASSKPAAPTVTNDLVSELVLTNVRDNSPENGLRFRKLEEATPVQQLDNNVALLAAAQMGEEIRRASQRSGEDPQLPPPQVPDDTKRDGD